MSRYGFGSIQSGRNNSNRLPSAILGANALTERVFFGRVISVVLDDSHPRYKSLGGNTAVGTVEFVDYNTVPKDTDSVNKTTLYKTAKPLFHNQKNIPILNEIVAIVVGPSKDLQSNTDRETLYYLNVLNLWSHPHHNSIPYVAGTKNPDQKQTYNTSQITPNRLSTQVPTLDLGPGFIERSDIHGLQPQLGDMILEGRWGNSLRFTNTGSYATTILRNGQGATTTSKFNLIQEDINKDHSSIYLLSNSKTSLIPSSTSNYFSYTPKTQPKGINSYNGNQLILNSDRVVLNSRTDHLLLTSNKSINLNARDSLNLETTGDTVIATGELYLGSRNATEPLLLGNVSVTLITQLATIVENLLLASSIAANSAGPIEPLATNARNLLTDLQKLKRQFESMKSNRNFTI